MDYSISTSCCSSWDRTSVFVAFIWRRALLWALVIQFNDLYTVSSAYWRSNTFTELVYAFSLKIENIFIQSIIGWDIQNAILKMLQLNNNLKELNNDFANVTFFFNFFFTALESILNFIVLYTFLDHSTVQPQLSSIISTDISRKLERQLKEHKCSSVLVWNNIEKAPPLISPDYKGS